MCLQWGRPEFDPWVGKIPLRRKWQPTPVLLPAEVFNLCFLVFFINSVPLRTQSSVPIFTWEQDYWLDCSLTVWTLLFLHQVTCVSSLTPLYSILLFKNSPHTFNSVTLILLFTFTSVSFILISFRKFFWLWTDK